MYIFANCGFLVGMESIVVNCCEQNLSITAQLKPCCQKALINKLTTKEEYIYYYDKDNKCLKPVGQQKNNDSFMLTPIGIAKLQCALSWWQQYIVGITDPQGFEISLKRDSIVNMSMDKNDPRYKDADWEIICLPGFANFTHLKNLICRHSSLFPDGIRDDLSEILDKLAAFEKYLFIKQRLFLRSNVIYCLDQLSIKYQTVNGFSSDQMQIFLKDTFSTAKQQHENNVFWYKSLDGISTLTLVGSLLMAYCYLKKDQLNQASILTAIISGFLSIYTSKLEKDTRPIYDELYELIEKSKKKYVTK
ncbi:MAG TPA: hypothetical protein VL201_01370 [Patescibacteria group bacterium]|jgi:hypothetical protein|nr:hypothetical protein [Patescibacteria group bacterium]